MIAEIRNHLIDFVDRYPKNYGVNAWWRHPLLVSAGADQRFDILPQIAAGDHWLPANLLPAVKSVIVFFVPFNENLVEENRPGKYPCPNWGVAYEETNELIERSGRYLAGYLENLGYEAVQTSVTNDAGLLARWSHKHLGHLAGLGRFGINAQLITPAGCAGRLGSLVTNADIGDHPLVTQSELCLHKLGEDCLECMGRCPVEAVKLTGIDRERCNKRLRFNRRHRIQLGLGERSHGCAKCQVSLPCSLTDPTQNSDPKKIINSQ